MSCQLCGKNGHTVNARFLSAVGMLYISRFFSSKGVMCPACMQKQFLEYTLTSLLLGWWSIPSLLATPVILAYNLAGFAAARVKFRAARIRAKVNVNIADRTVLA